MASVWKLHGDGRTIEPDAVVRPDERLAWPQMFGLGAQHVLARFGATVTVPLLTGFPVTTICRVTRRTSLRRCLRATTWRRRCS